MNPRNLGKPEKFNGVGKVGNPICGDVMYIYIYVEEDKITDIGFETMGCAAAIATSSMITDLAKGKNLNEAEKISRQDVANELGGLPPIKMHCSNLAAKGLREAIKDYRKKAVHEF
jgi:nitrogen fixation NifU-like protein